MNVSKPVRGCCGKGTEMKVVRTLVYDGPEEWIERVLQACAVDEKGFRIAGICLPPEASIIETDREIFPDPKPFKLNW